MNYVLIISFLVIAVVSGVLLFNVLFGVDLKEACLQSGGTSVEQPLGTFRKCLK